MAIIERTTSDMSERKLSTRIALLEKEHEYIEETLKRIEKKVDEINHKIDKVENKVYTNFKWFLGILFSGIISTTSIFSVYQYIKH